MYVFSIAVSLAAAAVLSRTVVRGKSIGLILELPPYRVPRPGATLRMMWDRSSAFLKEAGTIILVCTIALWALLSFPSVDAEAVSTSAPPAPVLVDSGTATVGAPAKAPAPANPEASAIEHSYAGRLGKAIEPILEPLGFDWKIGVGIIGAFAAREVFVSTLGLVYGMGEDAGDAPLRDRLKNQHDADGKPVYTPLMGLSLLVFFALAGQCMSTMAVVRRETASWRWPLFLFTYMTALAYLASFLVYQGGTALGF
jgi:ferrous iron transport protein B